jgi:hypothetical protein
MLPVAVVAGLSTALLGGGPGIAADPTQTNHTINMIILKYFPVTGVAPNQMIDRSVTGTVDPAVGNGSLADMQAHVNSVDANLKVGLSAATAYHHYNNSAATPSITYNEVANIEHDDAVPTVTNPHYGQGNPPDPFKVKPDYNQVMTRENICNYVNNQGVTEVWMWAYQGGSQLGISESEMSGPHGDVSNSMRNNAMPVCSKTYKVYTFNQFRGTEEATESYGHQIEAEMENFDSNLFDTLFENKPNPPYPAHGSAASRCGSVHNPPNASKERDTANTTPHISDCMNWDPNGLGPVTGISCQNWGCANNGDNDNPSINWIRWWMQSIPGKGNTVTYQGSPLSNWWDIHADFDTAWVRNAHGNNPLKINNYPAGVYGPTVGGGFSTVDAWFSGGGVGLKGYEIWTYGNGSTVVSTATWQAASLNRSFAYKVEAYIPDNYSDAPSAHYHLTGATGQDAYLNQQSFTNQYATLSNGICPDAAAQLTITLDDGGTANAGMIVGADAVRFTQTTTSCVAWPEPTTWCHFTVTATAGLHERQGPGTSYAVVQTLPYNQVVMAGSDATIDADGYTWRRIVDGNGLDGGGGFAASNWLVRSGGSCVS